MAAAQSELVAARPVAPRIPRKPEPVPTATPSPAATSTPSPAIAPSAPPTAWLSPGNAPDLVRSGATLTVGQKGSCGNGDVSIDVRGFTRGCTLFGLVTAGPLANGKGTIVVVPVSTTEDIRDVVYGLLYLQESASAGPRFIGLLAGHGSRPTVIRFEKGLIVLQDGAGDAHFTFDGRRITRV